MKTFENFINEENSKKNFIFAINIKNATSKQLDELFDLASKQFDKFDNYNEDVIKEIKNGIISPWALIFNMYQNYSDPKQFFTSFGIHNKTCGISLTIVTSPGWGAGYKYMDDIITIDEFLKVGFEGVKKYIKLKNDINKYNL